MESFLKNIERYFNIVFLGSDSLGLGKILASKTSIQIIEALSMSREDVGMTAQEVSEKLGIARSTVIYHLGRLQENGLIKLNPVLKGEDEWNNFWGSYKQGRGNISKEDFNRIHNARMKGEKLFLPTNRSVLLLPTTNTETGESLVREAFMSVNIPPLENSYNQSIKGASAAGIVGLMLLAVAFFYSPFLMPAGNVMSSATMAPEAMMADKSVSSLEKPRSQLKAQPEMAMDESPDEVAVAPGSGDTFAQEDRFETSKEEQGFEMSEAAPGSIEERIEETPSKKVAPEAVQQTSFQESSKTQKAIKYLAIFLIGSSVAFVIMGFLNKKEISKGSK